MNIIKNKYRGKKEYFLVKADLIRAAEYRGITTYQDVAVIMGLPITGQHMGTETGYMLGEISEDEIAFGRPMLSSVAVSNKGKPGGGYFDLAKQLGRQSGGQSDHTFWKQELEQVYKVWKRALPK